MSLSDCCVKGFKWEGTPAGTESKLSNNKAYVTGDNKGAAILFIHDVFGWRYPNVRLLADHLAKEVGATVYVPDFFDGWTVNWEAVEEERWADIDFDTLTKQHSREIRGPEIEACARSLKADLGFKKVGAIGYCYGGWAVCELAAHTPAIVDAVSMGHPSMLVKEDIDNIKVPVQILAPEHDPVYTAELKTHSFETLQKVKVPFEYIHFPNVVHGCLVRGSPKKEGERQAMARGKDAAVNWFKTYLG
ncbi:dienelactone hydrolase [Xylariaceae sp. FL0255]|nr:dienelactone hydrolase [Xylariaceae sp. FL0255]